jgi:hypothetical protein
MELRTGYSATSTIRRKHRHARDRNFDKNVSIGGRPDFIYRRKTGIRADVEGPVVGDNEPVHLPSICVWNLDIHRWIVHAWTKLDF